MRLELSIEKTKVVDLTEGFQFVGLRVRYKWQTKFGYMPRIEIPNSKQSDLQYKVRQMTGRDTTNWSLAHLLQQLNPILRGWGNNYRFCTNASRQFSALDCYVGDRIWRWLMKKHGPLHRKRTRLVRLPSLLRPTRKLWREGNVEQFLLSTLRLERFRRGWMRTPAYISAPGEPDHNERCTPGSEGGHQSPTAVMSHGAGARPYPTSQQRKGKYLGKAGGLICEPLKAASMRRLALSRFLSLLLHLFFP